MDIQIMYEIVENLKAAIPQPISISDVSGRIVISTLPTVIGSLNLLALEALNANAKTISFSNKQLETAGSAIPLTYQNRRIGALILESPLPVHSQIIELLCKTIELLYAEKAAGKLQENKKQEQDQFFYEWLHFQAPYTEALKKRGELLGINITKKKTLMLFHQSQSCHFDPMPMIQNLLSPSDILFHLPPDFFLVILDEDSNMKKRYDRILSVASDFHVGICPGESHLYTAYQAVETSLKLGELLFPQEKLHHFHKMQLVIALSRLDFPGIEQPFSLLEKKGKAAQLAETALTYIQLNGNIQKVCEALHIHRNSIPYRLHRIYEISGKNLMDSYDMLSLYASYICYTIKNNKSDS